MVTGKNIKNLVILIPNEAHEDTRQIKRMEYDSGRFNNSTASKPITLNSTGTFTYSGPSFDRAFPNYKMNGTVTVENQPLDTSFNTTTATNDSSSSTSLKTV